MYSQAMVRGILNWLREPCLWGKGISEKETTRSPRNQQACHRYAGRQASRQAGNSKAKQSDAKRTTTVRCKAKRRKAKHSEAKRSDAGRSRQARRQARRQANRHKGTRKLVGGKVLSPDCTVQKIFLTEVKENK